MRSMFASVTNSHANNYKKNKIKFANSNHHSAWLSFLSNVSLKSRTGSCAAHHRKGKWFREPTSRNDSLYNAGGKQMRNKMRQIFGKTAGRLLSLKVYFLYCILKTCYRDGSNVLYIDVSSFSLSFNCRHDRWFFVRYGRLSPSKLV